MSSATLTPASHSPSFLDILTGRTLRQRQARLGYFFILPVMLLEVIFFVIPTVFTLFLTFSSWQVQGFGAIVGLRNYQATLGDPSFWITMRNTLLLAVIGTPVTTLLALVTAVALQSASKVRFRTWFRLIYFLPVVTSMVAIAYIWKWLYNPQYGLLNPVLATVGIPQQTWLDSTVEVIPSLALIYVWARFGFDMIIFIAGLEGISPDYYEAARIDGAGRFQSFLHITVPLLNAQFVLVGILETINSVKLFDLPYAATNGGPAMRAGPWSCTSSTRRSPSSILAAPR